MACSEKQRLANQLNAQKSTGPVTAEGKRASRGNAVKHGFCSEVLALDAEAPEMIEQERQLWLDDLAPHDHVAGRMAERAFRAYLRLDRCDRARDARLAARQERATRDWELGLVAERDRGILMLKSHPTAAITLLRSIPQGCEWLADTWADLLREFETGISDEDHYPRILDLLGKQGGQHWRIKGQVLLYQAMLEDRQNMKNQGVPAGADEAYLRANLNGAYVDRVLNTRRRGEEAQKSLADFCRTQVESLRERDQTLRPRFLAERAQARAAALFDDSPEAARLHRYAGDADREMHRNVKAARSARREDVPNPSAQVAHPKELEETSAPNASPETAPRNEPISAIEPFSIASQPAPISPPEPPATAPRNEAISTVQPSGSLPETGRETAQVVPTFLGSAAQTPDQDPQRGPILAITGPVAPPAIATRSEPDSPPLTHNPRAIHPSILARLRAERAEREALPSQQGAADGDLPFR